jgi:hypothetical protein
VYRRFLGATIWHSNPYCLSWSNVNIETHGNPEAGALCLECRRLDEAVERSRRLVAAATAAK